MIGAIIGDIVGSVYEFNNHKSRVFELFGKHNFATDDSIMTLAIAKALKVGYKDMAELSSNAIKYMQKLGRPYPDCGFGGKFYHWIYSDNPQPYNSFGNGAAMRVSAVGFAARNVDEAKVLSKAVTEVSHNHREGIIGAESIAVAMVLARQGKSKDEIKEYISKNYYTLHSTVDDLYETYMYNETCQATVPQAFICFFESVDFEDAIRNAIYIGGDSDTLAAITGSIAEAYYGVPKWMENKAIEYLDERLLAVYNECRDWNKIIETSKRDELIEVLENPAEPKVKWCGGEMSDGTMQMPFAIYHSAIDDYIDNLYESDLLNKNYGSIMDDKGWWDETKMKEVVPTMTAHDVYACLTAIIRQDRFCEGLIGKFVDNGILLMLLKRLNEIEK